MRPPLFNCGGCGNFHCNSGVVWMKDDPLILSTYRRIAETLLASDIPHASTYFDAIAVILTTLGHAESHGCVRLATSSIEWLAARIGPGTPVTIAAA